MALGVGLAGGADFSTNCFFGLDHKYFLFPEGLACAVPIVGSQINVLDGH